MIAPAKSDYAIDLRDVHKRYKSGLIRRRSVDALRGVDFRIGRGEVFGLLGPNGAGKSTLIKILMTVIKPTSHEGQMLGEPIGHKPTLARVGYLPEKHQFPSYLTGAQVVDFYGSMAGVPRKDRRQRTGKLLDVVGLSQWANHKVGSYSKGMRQRVGIAQALINDPELVLLDEPTDGVDPSGRRDIRDVVARIRDEGRTVFLNSHLLSELEMVCERVAIMVKGRVQSQGTINDLTIDRARYEVLYDSPTAMGLSAMLGSRLEAEVAQQGRPSFLWRAAGWNGEGEGSTLHGGIEVYAEPGRIAIKSIKPQDIQPVLDAVRAKQGVIKDVTLRKPSLEDLFMDAVTDDQGVVLKPGAAGKGEA